MRIQDMQSIRICIRDTPVSVSRVSVFFETLAKGHNCIDLILIIDASLKTYHMDSVNFIVKDFNARFLETLEYYSRTKILIASDSKTDIDTEEITHWFPVEKFHEKMEETSYLYSKLSTKSTRKIYMNSALDYANKAIKQAEFKIYRRRFLAA